MSPDQPNPMDQQNNTAKGNVSWGRRILTAVGLIVLLVVIVIRFASAGDADCHCDD